MTATRLIAQGRTAEIYPWDNGYVLKLFREWCPPDWVDYEARIARTVYAAGVPSPAPGEIIEVEGRRGLIYERLNGISMLQDLNARPWMVFKHALSLAELQAEINQKFSTELPSYKDRLIDDIRSTPQLNEDLRRKSLALLDVLPNRPNICHGDFHPGNVLITKKGPVVIDWMTACVGSPWADVARTSLLLSVGVKAAGKQVNPFVRIMVKLFQRVYLNRYKRLVPEPENEMEHWMPVIAAARLKEEIIPEREALIEMVKGSSRKR